MTLLMGVAIAFVYLGILGYLIKKITNIEVENEGDNSNS